MPSTASARGTASAAGTATARGTSRRERPDRPGYRPYPVLVRHRVRLSPTFIRLTLHVDGPYVPAACGHDQRIKLLLPGLSGDLDAVPRDADWFSRLRELPDPLRPVLRTYTVRQARPQQAELDIDVALHGPARHGRPGAGPGASWAATARPGQRALLVGPDRAGTGPAYGVEWAPPATTRAIVLAGDETAVPAVCAILEALPENGPSVLALLEVPDPADQLSVRRPERARLEWMVRAHHPHGQLLSARVRQVLDLPAAAGRVPVAAGPANALSYQPASEDMVWDVPTGPSDRTDNYVWLAGEAGVMRELRHLVHRGNPARSTHAVMGYWRRGQHGT